jgi:hypothetical protein
MVIISGIGDLRITRAGKKSAFFLGKLGKSPLIP